MGATEEQMALVAASGMDHVAYILILYSVAFLMFLFVNMLISVYDRADMDAAAKQQPGLNGGLRGEEDGREELRGADEFELEGLVTDDDEDDEGGEGRKLLGVTNRAGDGFASQSTVGRNSERGV